ncbi:hypothetical protein V2J09_020920 [Rumex salicifolius]
MKHTLLHLCSFLLLFLALLVTSESIYLLSKINQGEDVKVSEIKSASVGTTMVEDDTPINELMGFELESCEEDRDEECLKRRLISEAHLDYIYTQQNKN